ncbi:MAG: cis-L-3-hydroxyproline dehydratase [Thermomicrobiales bacterium]|nr:cis-L-3-hydroxyproline dehydratase [Thermomicrobiales bacterium]
MGHVVAELSATTIVAGDASGEAITANEPLSFWGGLNPETGEIIDRRHPLSGRIVTGRVLVLPHGRGSCSASGVFLEAIRNGTAPAAVIVSRVDPIIGLGAILGEELYERTIPVSLISPQDRAAIADGDRVEFSPDGRVLVSRNPASAE